MRVSETVYSNSDPLPEGEARALAINEALREPLSEFLNEQQRLLRRVLGVAATLTLIGIGLLATGATLLGTGGVFGGLLVGGVGYRYVDDRDPGVQVTGIEKGYWTGYTIPGEDGVLFYDATATVPTEEFELEQVRDEEDVAAARAQLEELGDFPVVMAEDQSVEGEFTEVLETVEAELEATESAQVTAPVIAQGSPASAAITTLVHNAEAGSVPAATEIDVEEAEQDLADLSELGQLASETPVEAELEAMSEVGQTAADDLLGHQEEAIETLNDHIQTAADAFGIVSYNFYCPACQEDDIESQLVVPDDPADDVYCETCRSYHAREEAIPRHKIKDDVVAPTWDQLWAEKADEKREIYENIEDQKLDLKEREYEQSREEIRTATERIRDIRSKIRDLKTQAEAAEGAVDEIGELMVKYERLNEERKEQFSNEVADSFEEIDEETERILEETRSEEQERLAKAEEEAEQKAEMLRVEERQRQAEMLAAQRQMHQEIAAEQMHHREQVSQTELEAEAEMTRAKLDQEAKHHRENWMLKTRGKTSFSDRIDRMKMGKDRLLRASVRGD